MTINGATSSTAASSLPACTGDGLAVLFQLAGNRLPLSIRPRNSCGDAPARHLRCLCRCWRRAKCRQDQSRPSVKKGPAKSHMLGKALAAVPDHALLVQCIPPAFGISFERTLKKRVIPQPGIGHCIALNHFRRSSAVGVRLSSQKFQRRNAEYVEDRQDGKQQ